MRFVCSYDIAMESAEMQGGAGMQENSKDKNLPRKGHAKALENIGETRGGL
jgi:hypothetical protein